MSNFDHLLTLCIIITMKTKDKKVIKIQVPIKKELRDKAEVKAEEIGFGSVQEVIRLFLAGFVRGEYRIGFNPIEDRDIKD